MPTKPKIASRILAALLLFLGCSSVHSGSKPSQDETSLSAAVCPIVYPDDQSPGARGYHYTFFGNAFFINDQGYLLTAAHVLETFRDGGQPYILVNRLNAPPSVIKVEVIAEDATHDVAVLRAMPNPFRGGNFRVTYVPLADEASLVGKAVLAASLRPVRLRDAHSFEWPQQDASAGQVLRLESTRLDKAGPASEVFLLSHPVVRGQSGAPVLGVDAHGVVGFIEGRWLRGSVSSTPDSSSQSNSVPGAAVPIHHAIALLQLHNIIWHTPVAAQP
jgi:S1-C subfamily serine protease